MWHLYASTLMHDYCMYHKFICWDDAAHRVGTNASIYIAIRPSVCPSVMLITHLSQPTLTHQLSNIINPLSSYFKFVTASKCGNQIAFCSGLKTKKWRKLEQHSIENYGSIVRATELHSGDCRFESRCWTDFFSSKISTFYIHVFLKFSFDNTVPWHSKHASKQDLSEIKCTSSGNWLLNDSCFHSFITARWRHWCREKKTVNSCCTFLSKPPRWTLGNYLSCGFNPTLS